MRLFCRNIISALLLPLFTLPLSAQIEKAPFLITIGANTDTLWLQHHPGLGTEQYSLTWRNDTISKEWSYSEPAAFIKRMDTLEWTNLFLLQVSSGDGCPAEYRLLAFKQQGGYFLSEYFGNCEDVFKIKYTYSLIIFDFKAWPRGNRKKERYVYDGSKFLLTKS